MTTAHFDPTSVTPELIHRACGGYLAVSQEGSRIRIGVEGKTEEEARQRFRESLQKWARILNEQENES